VSIILGIDPGSRITGYGLIHAKPNNQHQFIACGCIRIDTETLGTKLKRIHQVMAELIKTYAPEEAAFEQIFFHENPGTALKLGQARGAAIAAAALYDLQIHEYTARQVKKAVVGYGAADKHQIQHMVQVLLKLEEKPQVDAADALAIALCHAYTRQGLLNIGSVAVKMRYRRLR
jgi:crossover junction endodeoxyribonuclease RuvC